MRFTRTIASLIIILSLMLVSDCKRFEPEGYLKVTTSEVEFLGGNSYMFNGAVKDLGGQAIREHGFCWSATAIPTVNNTITKLGARSVPGLISSEVSGFMSSTQYNVRAYAITALETLYGENKQFVALNTTPDVETLEVNNIGVIGAQVVSQVSADEGVVVDQKGVCWNSTGEPNIDGERTEDGSGAGSFTSDVRGLACNTNYFVRAYAIVSGVVTYGNVLEFTSASCELPAVGTFNAHSITAYSVRLGGVVYEEGASPVLSRGIVYGKNPNPVDGGVFVEIDVEEMKFYCLVSDLDPENTYYYQAYATNSAGTGYEYVYSFDTKAHGPVDEIAFAAVQWMPDWDQEPAYPEKIGYKNYPYEKAFYAARTAPAGWDYYRIVDGASFDATWDAMGYENSCKNLISNGVAGDPANLDGGPAFGFSWKGVHDGNKLYIFIKAWDAGRILKDESVLFEIADQPSTIYRHEATFIGAQDSGENRIAYENMAYARYIELGGGLCEFNTGEVIRYQASIGLERLESGSPYWNGGWENNMWGLEALQNEDHFWQNDGEGNIRAVYVMPFDGALSYPVDPTNLDGSWERIKVRELISFDIKASSLIKGGSGADGSLQYAWSADHNNCWASTYYAGELFLHSVVIDLPLFE